MAGYSPGQCAVVDDSSGPLAWVLQVGARVAVAVGKGAEADDQSSSAAPRTDDRLVRASSLSLVPAALERFEA